jgi:hypothetical protein
MELRNKSNASLGLFTNSMFFGIALTRLWLHQQVDVQVVIYGHVLDRITLTRNSRSLYFESRIWNCLEG